MNQRTDYKREACLDCDSEPCVCDADSGIHCDNCGATPAPCEMEGYDCRPTDRGTERREYKVRLCVECHADATHNHEEIEGRSFDRERL